MFTIIQKLSSRPKNKILRIILLILLIEVIFVLDIIVPVSLAAFYIMAIILSNLQLSSRISYIISFISIILSFSAEYLHLGISSGLIMRYVIITFSFLSICWITSQAKKELQDLIEHKNKLEEAKEKQELLKEEIVCAFTLAIESKNKYTLGHSRKVAEYAKMISQQMQLTEEEIEFVNTAALLHDIGKLNVPTNVLTKSSELTAAERKQIERHAMEGAKILNTTTSLQEYIPAVKFHHERWDGTGYPYGLKGFNIPLAARIIAVADSFEAMTSDRAYRTKMSKKHALEEIKICRGVQFDPEVADAFLATMEEEGYIPRQISSISKIYSGHAILLYDKDKLPLTRNAIDLIEEYISRKWKVIASYDDITRSILTNKFKTQIRSKQLEILTASEYDWFGHIPKEDVSYNLDKIYSQAKKEGYEGLLLTSDGEYIGKELGIRNLFKAESYINQAIKNKSIVVVCMYSANETALDPRINDLLLSHTYLLNNDNFINIKEKMEREKINDEQILEEILK